MSEPSIEATKAPKAQWIVQPELASTLEAQGPNGQRASSLLLDAAQILNRPTDFHTPYEVAQSCLRGALDSVLSIAGENFPGLQSARRTVTEAAGAVADAWRQQAEVTDADREALVSAVENLRAEQENRGGFRTRQIGHLVLEQTRHEMGLAETEAARNWTTFYNTASRVLHGSSSSADDTHRQFNYVVAAMEQLFLGLPERADRLRELAQLEAPTQQDASEIALITDPRAGEYFFRAAVSEQWLELLPLHRLLPEERRWSAAPYLRRLLVEQPERICSWSETHLDAICQQGPDATSQVVTVISEAGMAASTLLTEVMRRQPDRYVLLRVGDWARDIPLAERTGKWVQVVERILRIREFTAQEEWETSQLVQILIETAHPGGRLRTDGDRLGVITRSALAGTLSDYLDGEETHWDIEVTNDLGGISLGDPPHGTKLTLMRAVLDLALAEARLAVPIDQRLRAVYNKLSDSSYRARLVAVHLTESFPCDSQQPVSTDAWWDAAIAAAQQVGGGKRPNKDLADFLALLNAHCPEERRDRLKAALTATLGTPPTTDEISAWLEGFPEAVPSPWRSVRDLAPVLPDTVCAPWQQVLGVLEEKYGPPADRPEPVVKTTNWLDAHGELSLSAFAARAEADGPTAAVEELVRTPVSWADEDADDARVDLLRELVFQEPDNWASFPGAVATAAARPMLQAAYFNALHLAANNGSLNSELLPSVVKAAFAVRPPLQDQTPGALYLERVISNILHRAWDTGGSLGTVDTDAVDWLRALIHHWTTPRLSSTSPVIDAVETPGGSALLSLMAWGFQQSARSGSVLPEPVTTTLETLLNSEPDDQALSVIGFRLSQMNQADPHWVTDYAAALLSLDSEWRPARSWLTRGRRDNALLAQLDRIGLWNAMCVPQAGGAIDKAFCALLDEAKPLGPTDEFLIGLADQQRGPRAISTLLSRLATSIIRVSEPGEWPARAAAVWRAALDAHLPVESLRGAGRFAYASTLDEETWLELTDRTMTQLTSLEAPHRVAERAARSPSSPAARRIAAAALSAAPINGFRRAEIIRHAADLFAHIPAGQTAERETLRRALINAGAIEQSYGD
ncbi:hypothetical protein KGD83_16030 [Nocardiopsis akebiae]|uniref:ATP-binding protein n=1 Tax=Nocardiopsis akebiae TaxID=2831968 RepID=A0ABX8C0A9_9ACTN|nr:hypothetical protein [Nocardiopsis akebiae]QUX26879.1 hypothetical protein KGD83_16030 [Nocardiopsis akebiae]